jgi:hypothetical protein
VRRVSATPLLFAAIAFSAPFCLSAGLDAPATVQPPTVGSEIKRGVTAVSSCGSGKPVGTVIDCGVNAERTNIQNKQATDAFLLGVWYQTWQYLIIVKMVDGSTPLTANALNTSYGLFTKYQKLLSLTDRDVCEAAQKVCEVILSDLDKYRRAQ